LGPLDADSDAHGLRHGRLDGPRSPTDTVSHQHAFIHNHHCSSLGSFINIHARSWFSRLRAPIFSGAPVCAHLLFSGAHFARASTDAPVSACGHRRVNLPTIKAHCHLRSRKCVRRLRVLSPARDLVDRPTARVLHAHPPARQNALPLAIFSVRSSAHRS
jgi:hypothetical protein